MTETNNSLSTQTHLNTEIISTDFGIPFVDLESIDLKHLPLELVSSKLIREHLVLPILKRGNCLLIATADPAKVRVLDEIKFHTRLNVEQILVEEDKLIKAIDDLLANTDSPIHDLLNRDLDQLTAFTSDEPQNNDNDFDIDDAPIVRFE